MLRLFLMTLLTFTTSFCHGQLIINPPSQPDTIEGLIENVPEGITPFEMIPVLPNGMPIWCGIVDNDFPPMGHKGDRWVMLPIQRYHQAVVKIATKVSVPKLGMLPVMGTGTVIEVNEDTVTIVTAYHVVPLIQTKQTINIGYNDQTATLNVTPELWADAGNDLAIIRIKRRKTFDYVSVPVSENPPILGDLITYAGYGGGSIGVRRFKAPIKRLGTTMFSSDIDCIGGDSGGPALNQENQLVGVISCGVLRFNVDNISMAWPLTSQGHGPLTKLLKRYRAEKPDYPEVKDDTEERVQSPDTNPELSGGTRLADPEHARLTVPIGRARHLLFPPGISDAVGGSQSQR